MKRPLLWYAGAYALGEVLALHGGGLWPAVFLAAAGTAAVCCLRKSKKIFLFVRRRARRACPARRSGGQGVRGRRVLWFFLSLFFVLGSLRLSRSGDPPAVRRLDGILAEKESLTGVLSGRIVRMELRSTKGEESFRLLLSGCSFRPEDSEKGGIPAEEAGDRSAGPEETEVFPVGGVQLTLEELPEGVREGRDLTMRVRLSEMEEPGNPGQFDSRSYYRSQGISYRAKGTALLAVSGRTDCLRMGLRLLRQYGSDNLLRTAGEESGGMLCAMVLGEKWEADGGSVSLYTESGMGHLLAISGLHISLAGMGVWRLLRKRLNCSYVLAAAGCTAMSFCYYLLTGEGTSAGRAFFMLTVYGIGQALGRQYDLASAAALSALVMLLRRPLLLFQSGFLLSFGSVLALGLIYPLLSRAGLPKFLSPLFPGLSIQLLTLPVQASFFYKIPVYGLLLNLAVLPLFTAAALLGIAGALLGGALPGLLSLLLRPAGWILGLYEFLGARSLRLPGAVWRTGRPENWQLLLYGMLLLLFCRWLLRRAAEKKEEEKAEQEKRMGEKTKEEKTGEGKRAGRETEERKKKEKKEKRGLRRGGKSGLPGLLLFAGLFLSLTPVRGRELEITFLNVGQGDSCFLRTPEGVTFLVDGGSSDQKEVGEYRLEPFLDVRAVKGADFALVSHGDADHINGIAGLIGTGRIGALVLPRGREEGEGLAALKEQAEEAGIPVLFLGRGERLTAGEAAFTCLWPEASGGKAAGSLEENEASMVLWFSWRELDVLFTGDLEGGGEDAVTGYLEAYRKASGRRADILKVPHHGSGGAGGTDFLEAAAPGYGVISCGKNNRYGHPAQETLERLSAAGCRVFRTDRCGAVTVRSNGERVRISGYRGSGIPEGNPEGSSGSH